MGRFTQPADTYGIWRIRLIALCAGASLMLAAGGPAQAFPGKGNGSHQGPNAAHYKNGYGRKPRSDALPYTPPSFRDPSNAYVFSAGRPHSLQGGVGARSASRPGGATTLGAGSGAGASAVGNLLSVVVEGHGNTVIIDADQVNNGSVSASISFDD